MARAARRHDDTRAQRRARWPKFVLFFAALFLVDAVLVGGDVADRLLSGGTEDPSSASARATEVLEEHFPVSQPNLVLLVEARGGGSVDDREVAAEGIALAERLAFEPDVSGVTSYWQTGADQLRSDDSRHALILAHLDGDEDLTSATLERIAPGLRGTPEGTEHVQVRIGGSVAVLDSVQSTIEEDLLTAELIALPLTLLILFLVFGGVVAALLPLGVGIVAILGTNAVLRVITEFADVSVFAQNLTTALGLGLAIDYALLIVRRYREELARGSAVAEAVATTVRTAGRAVIFSALTVAVSLSAMLVFPQYFLRSFAYAGIAVVLLAAAAALVVLPALLMVLGPRVDALSLRRGRRAPATPGAGADAGGAVWRRIASASVGRAPLFALGTTVLLIIVGLPFLRVEFGTTDDRQLPSGAEPSVAQEIIREGFESSATATVEVVARSADPSREADATALADYAGRLSVLPGVSYVDTPVGTWEDGELLVSPTPAHAMRTTAGMSHVSVVPESGIEVGTPEAAVILSGARDLAGQERFAGFDALVGGSEAELQDSKDAISSRLGWAALIIVGASLLLMFLLTGSVLLPVMSVVLNALSLTAMFGVVVWVFQDGNLSGFLGFTATGTIEVTLPVLMFCVAFGLSMDYGVFLLSRITEEHRRGADRREAIVAGVQRTGGVITAAALILSVVLVAIGTSRITNTKMLGLGVALAVIVDSTVVRGLLVPAVMRLGGAATWWAPGPLRRFQERFGLREEAEIPPGPPPGAGRAAPVRPAPEPVLEEAP
ncbi:MMPL family transporter [Streptomyces sp. DSM 44917]|uniref:MMPL family transporter n=1 Tax=Streptomyces boetiae TaxID=3075541 RepID=A0ABU2L784_9ACTN|nr:MMPL family transporter [Streptomyces sp. DSM 44917]MDT0307365.1 MMPL family transporter [Streptomyces sp. DSM 44917]